MTAEDVLRIALAALEKVQDADQHDGQWDGCSLCNYHTGWDKMGPAYTDCATHEIGCPVGDAIKACKQFLEKP